MKTVFTLILFTLAGYCANSAPGLFPPVSADFGQLRSNLYIVTPEKTTVLMDGTLTQYDINNNNGVDGKDGRKMFNPSENFGMPRENTMLIVERRKTIVTTDTIFFKMWNMRIITYQLELITDNLNHNDRTAVIEDKYLNTSTEIDLNGKTYINFSVTSDPASKMSDRFRIIFNKKVIPPPPFAFTGVKALLQNNSVTIDWKTENEKEVNEFEVERSADGKYFQKMFSVKAGDLSLNQYSWVDHSPAEGNNYYRVSTTGKEGKRAHTDVVNIYVNNGETGISLYPNPAVSNNLNLRMVNQPAGKYEVRLINSFGRIFMAKTIQHSAGKIVENINPSQNIPGGIYKVQVITPAGEKRVLTVIF